jgi:V8-like Glu-specific endopeptidase
MYEISNRTTAPYSSICYISCEWADGSVTRASGVIIGQNDVLTAHHVVYDESLGGYATRITIIPGADSSPLPVSAPYGSYSDVSVIYARTATWDPDGDGLLYAHESQYDMAVLGLSSTAVSAQAGWVGISGAPGDFNGKIDGYPARGTGLMEEAVFADASADTSVYNIATNLGAGASGGPLLRTDATGTYVAGVLSSGSSNFAHSTYAGLFGAGNWEWITNAIAADNSVLPGGSTGGVAPLSGSGAGVIVYIGTAGSDTLTGTSADESLRGGSGTDSLNGQGGIDTAIYLYTRNEYRLSHSAGTIAVSDMLGDEGTDTLQNIERVSFEDMTVNLEIGVASRTIAPSQLKLLEELYVAFFNRVPEADGLAYWIEQSRVGVSINQIADAFYDAAVLYPTLTRYSGSMSHTDFVNTVYRNVLGRADGGDAEGVAFWSGALANGTQTRGALVTSMLASAHTFKGNATWGWVADLLDNKAEVAHRFAVEMGLGYKTAYESVFNGMQIAHAVTATDTSAAIALIGVDDTFSNLG